MATQNDSGCKTFEADAATGAFLLVRVDSAGEIVVCNATTAALAIGATGRQIAVAAGDYINVELFTKPGTHTLLAGGTIAVGDTVYGAASGKVTAAPGIGIVGYALTSAASGETVEVYVDLKQQMNVGFFSSGGTIAANTRVHIASGVLAASGLTDNKWIGTTLAASVITDVVAVALRATPIDAISAGAITQGAIVNTAASGKVDDAATSTGYIAGIALEAATGADEVISILPLSGDSAIA